jgi:beta-glucosidase
MKARTFAAAAVAVMAVAACAQPGPARRAQCAERARALVMKMTPEERLTQIFMSSREIPRLGIRHREWWNEALHGVARTGLATVFPQSIGAGATFDTDLEYRMARIISE